MLLVAGAEQCQAQVRLSQPGVQIVGTAGTGSTGQTIFVWTKWDLDGEKIGHIMGRAMKFLTSDINTLSNKYWTQCPMNIEDCAS